VSVIAAGDGREVGLAMLALLVGATVLPVCMVWAWHLFREIVEGETETDA
jgi:uncharacterized membrane protein